MRIRTLTLIGLVAAACDPVMTPETMSFHPTVATSGTCETDFQQSSISGLADVSRGAGYSTGVTIENPLVTNAAPGEFRTNTHDVFITSVEITYTAVPAGSISLPTLVMPIFLSISAGGRATVEGFPLISAEAAGLLNASAATTGVIANVVFVGRTSTNQTTMRTSAAPFPISICRGCASLPLECVFVQADGTVALKNGYLKVICPGSTEADPNAWTCIKQVPADDPNVKLETLEVAATATSIAVGGQTELTVTGTFSDTTTEDLTAASTGTTYAVRTPAVASVSAEGIVTALAVGTTSVVVTNAGKTARVTLTVTAAAP